MSSSISPCAACKLRRQKCTQECVFAPYFPPDQPQKFANVHKVFGASNVAKLLSELNATQREDAVNSLAYEAEFRLRDPVYGCVGLISLLQHKLKQMQSDLYNAKKELASYIGPQAMLPILQPPTAIMAQQGGSPSSSAVLPYNMSGIPPSAGGSSQQMLIRDSPQQHHQMQQQQQQQQLFEAQQLAVAVAAREQQEMFRAYEQKQTQQHHHSQRQHELLRFNGFDPAGTGGGGGFNQMNSASNLTLGTFVDNSYQIQTQPEHSHSHSHHHHQQQLPVQLFLQPQQTQVEQQQQQQQPHQHQSQQTQKPEATADDAESLIYSFIE